MSTCYDLITDDVMLCDCAPITLIRSFLLSANLRSSDISWVDTKKQIYCDCASVYVCACVCFRGSAIVNE